MPELKPDQMNAIIGHERFGKLDRATQRQFLSARDDRFAAVGSAEQDAFLDRRLKPAEPAGRSFGEELQRKTGIATQGVYRGAVETAALAPELVARGMGGVWNPMMSALGMPERSMEPYPYREKALELLKEAGGRPYEPETPVERALERGGEFTGASAVPLGPARALKPASRVGKALVDPLKKYPAQELAMGAGGGLGAGAAREVFPDHPAAEVGGALVGAAAPAAGIAAAGRRAGQAIHPPETQVPTARPAQPPTGWRYAAGDRVSVEGRPAEIVESVNPGGYVTVRFENGKTSYLDTNQVAPPSPRQELADQAAEASAQRAAAPDAIPEAAALDEAVASQTLQDMPGPGIEKRLEQGLNRNVVDAAEEVLTAGGVQRDPNRMISDQIMELLATDRLDRSTFDRILSANNLTPESFAQVWRVNTRKAAQDLQLLAGAESRLRRLSGDAGADEMLEAAGSPNIAGMSIWRRIENIRRGLLVTQMATAVRNAVTQVGRLGIDTVQQGMDSALLRVFPDRIAREHPTDAFGALSRIFWNPRVTKRQVDEVLSRFPREEDALFMRYSSDLNRAGAGSGAMARAERGVQMLNVMNRFQEFTIRRAVFASQLDRSLAKRGTNLEEIIARNEVGKLDRDSLKEAIEKSLEMTWAKDFSPGAAGAEGMAGSFIRFVNKTGAGPVRLTQAIPFPRFLMNAVKFQYEHSPLPLMKLAYSPKEWAKVASGDVSTITKGTIGTGMLLAAYQARKSDAAGERWYQFQTPDGSTIDTRPFNPFASYLFVADVILRANEGRLHELRTRDIAQGLLSANLRAGAGMYAMDQLIEGLAGIGSADKVTETLKGYTGEVAGSFTVPLRQIRDLVAEFDESERVIRDKSAAPLAGPTLENIPYASQKAGLPDVELPTQAAAPKRGEPLLRQTTGLSITDPKNPGQREMDRLGFTRGEILPSTGEPEVDRAVAHEMGPLFEQIIIPFVESAEYKEMTNAQQGATLKRYIAVIRKQARLMAEARAPEQFQKLRVQRTPVRQRRMIEEQLGRKLKPGDM